MNWLEHARREIPECARRRTAITAKRSLTAVTAVLDPALCGNLGASNGSNGSTPPTRIGKTASVREAFEEPLREAKPDRFTEAEPDIPPIAARRLLLAAEEAGLELAVDGGKLAVAGPDDLKWLAQELFRAEPAIVEILQARSSGVVVLLSRREQGELDPDTVRALREREEQRWAIPCFVCGKGRLFWHRKGGPLVCCTCHPPADEGIVYRRVRFEYVS